MRRRSSATGTGGAAIERPMVHSCTIVALWWRKLLKDARAMAHAQLTAEAEAMAALFRAETRPCLRVPRSAAALLRLSEQPEETPLRREP